MITYQSISDLRDVSVENSLKQRIIGAIVLAALAIIFLPAILKEKTSNGTFESKIPEKPQELEEYRVDTDKIEKLKQAKDSQHERQVVKENSATENQASANELKESVKPAQANTDKTASRKTKTKDSQPEQLETTKTAEVPVGQAKPDSKQLVQSETLGPDFKSAAWVVQVASFSNESNAVNLVEKLKKHQFKAYRRKSKADNKTVYRVYVGPFIDKPKAESKTAEISKVSETKVVLRVFDPVKH